MWASKLGSNASAVPNKISQPEKINVLNQKALQAYRSFLNDIVLGVEGYRRAITNNVYLSIPQFPEDVFSNEVPGYRGSVIFNDSSSWFIHITAPKSSIVSPGLTITSMIRGTSAGELVLSYNFRGNLLTFERTGVIIPPFRDFPAFFTEADFTNASKRLVQTFLEHEAKNAKLEPIGN